MQKASYIKYTEYIYKGETIVIMLQHTVVQYLRLQSQQQKNLNEQLALTDQNSATEAATKPN